MKQNTGVAIIMLFALSGCGLTGGETTPPSAGLYVVNASPDAPAIDVTLNSNTIATNYVYGKDSGYFLVFPGIYEFKLSQTGSTNSLTDQLLNLPAGKYFSLFLIDSFNASLPNVVFTEDNLTTDTFSYAKVRVLDFCPNSPTLDASFTNVYDTIKFAGRYFNDQSLVSSYSNFSVVPAGTYDLSLYDHDTTTVIKQFSSINFQSGKQYTVYLKGLYENTTTPLDTAIIRH
ncbi:DUF4397 domain-containing protein [Panacibacter ginsenosidivorans]|uniref:DUF4397 domain-containing protein n=1 Tax=Panacibacter ginsenosidivorans TaxID=1813871 RepID=A0A5B8V4L3_9BACT|nr:DUF4397 domain-containing protein [Panacibacter ginsenosidivorans]QEC66320.1 DUF4397 domain-containing protein [Panacibacter ginsenosidivorans]